MHVHRMLRMGRGDSFLDRKEANFGEIRGLSRAISARPERLLRAF